MNDHRPDIRPISIVSELSADGEELLIRVAGRFDFSAHQDFRGAYEHLAVEPRRYRVDLSETGYLDSSALGMLLLRDYAGGDRADVTISNCNRDVRKILAVSNFEQLFVID